MKIGIVVIGASGYMGKTGLNAIYELKKELRIEGHRRKIEVLAAIDVEYSKFDEIIEVIKNYEETYDTPPIHVLLQNALITVCGHFYINDGQFPIIFYDASPASIHFDNYNFINEFSYDGLDKSNLIYFGEKPFILDPVQYNAFDEERNNNVYCDFIELKNPAFEETIKYIEENDLKIKNMTLWRAGPTGIKKFVNEDRDGVQGGALEDKSLHDLSISVGLIGSDKIRDYEISNEKAHCFILPEWSDINNEEDRCFLSASNKKIEFNKNIEERFNLPADGFSTFSVLWKLNSGEQIQSNYIFSWLGLVGNECEEEIIAKIESYGLNFYEKFLARNVKSNQAFQYTEEEIRLGIIECTDNQGKDVVLICNFLPKHTLSRFVCVFEDCKLSFIYTESDIGDYSAIKYSSMKRMFKDIIDKIQDNENNSKDFGEKPILIVHDILLKVRNSIFDHEYSIESEYDKLLDIYEKKAKLKRTPN